MFAVWANSLLRQLDNLELDSSSFAAATRALVVLNVLGLCRSDLHTFTVKPALANITANPELIAGVLVPTCATLGSFLFIILFLFVFHLTLAALFFFG